MNESIRETLLKPDSNEFALMNNGITILSDETNFSERIGIVNRAQLRVLNPQIINGGQTAYTLSRVLNEDRDAAIERFSGKEVLTRIITLTPKQPDDGSGAERNRLITEISNASNHQTPVIYADKASNEPYLITLQKILFERYGLFFERKRGEFSDGVHSAYIDKSVIVDRNIFFRVFLAARGGLNRARKKRIFINHGLSEDEILSETDLEQFFDAYALFRRRVPSKSFTPTGKYRNVLARVFIATRMTDRVLSLDERLLQAEKLWLELIRQGARSRNFYSAKKIDRESGAQRVVFLEERWVGSNEFENDIKQFVEKSEIGPRIPPVRTPNEPAAD